MRPGSTESLTGQVVEVVAGAEGFDETVPAAGVAGGGLPDAVVEVKIGTVPALGDETGAGLVVAVGEPDPVPIVTGEEVGAVMAGTPLPQLADGVVDG